MILINMEMPKRCGECPLSLSPNSPCWKNGGAVDWENRPNWCPLIPVPEHGRLIDADALGERFWDGQCYFTDAIKSKLQSAPTIIPADKEEEG